MILEEEPVLEHGAGVEPGGLHEAIVKTFRKTRDIPIEIYESDSRERILAELVPQVWRVSEETQEVLAQVLELYESAGGSPTSVTDADDRQESGFLRQIDRLMADRESRVRISDVAFLGRIELRRRMTTLLATTQGIEIDPWRILGCSGSCLRGLRKALTAVEVLICEYQGFVARLSFSDEVLLSLQVRRAYAKFRCEVRQFALRPELDVRLRGAATSIARLVGRDIYADLRIEDRFEIRQLQRRIHDCLNRQDPVEGRQLWQDVLGFTELIGEIRKRQELVAHDRDLAALLRRRLETGEAYSDGALADLFAPLMGLDDALDDFLIVHLKPSGGNLESHLQKLLQQLTGAR